MAHPAAPTDGQCWLCDTQLLQHQHPRIRLLSLRLTQLKCGDADKATACYQFVRQMPFACAADPAGTPSVAVLACGGGDCHTKSTLFIALLRSLGIPARAHVVSLPSNHLRGIMETGGRPVDHVFTEVLIGAGWLGVDSYVADLRLELAARRRLLQEHRSAGYGVHLRGDLGWDARRCSFGHFCGDEPQDPPRRDLGSFHDVQHFQQAADAQHRAGWARRQQGAIAAALANRRIRSLRESAPAAPCLGGDKTCIKSSTQ